MKASFVKSVLAHYSELLSTVSLSTYYYTLLDSGYTVAMALDYLKAALVPRLSETHRKRIFGKKYSSIPKAYTDTGVIYSNELKRAQLRGILNKMPDKNTFIVLGGHDTDFYNYDSYKDFESLLRSGYSTNWGKVDRYVNKWQQDLDMKYAWNIDRLAYNEVKKRVEYPNGKVIHKVVRKTNHLHKILRERDQAPLIIRVRDGEFTLVKKPEDFGKIINNELFKTSYLSHIHLDRVVPTVRKEYRTIRGNMEYRDEPLFKCIGETTGPVRLYLKSKPTAYQVEQFYINNPHATLWLYEKEVEVESTKWYFKQTIRCINNINPAVLCIIPKVTDLEHKVYKQETTEQVGAIELPTKVKVHYIKPKTFLTAEDLEPAEGMPHGLGFEATLMDLEMNGLIVSPGMTRFDETRKSDAAYDAICVGNSEMLESMIFSSYIAEDEDVAYVREQIQDVVREYEWILQHKYLDAKEEAQLVERFLREEKIVKLIEMFR